MLIAVIMQAQIVTSVTLTPTTISIIPGQTTQITSAILPANALNDTLNWTSSNSSVAMVDQNGILTAISIGTATITATTTDGSNITASSYIQVTPVHVSSISITPSNLTIPVGGTGTITTSILPVNATNTTVTWTSSNVSVATINLSGVVTGLSVGTDTITATANDGSGIIAKSVVTVSNIAVQAISLDNTTLSLSTTSTPVIIIPTFSPSNAVPQYITWTTSNATVATVDQTGKVTPVGVGTTTITATVNGNGVSATCEVTVSSIPVTSITISPTTFNIAIGETNTLVASILPVNASGIGVTWTSNNPAIATVNPNGLVTGIAAGTVEIKATSNDGYGVYSAITGTVSEQLITSISFPYTTLDVYIGTPQLATPNIYPLNATNKQLTWTSSDSGIATVDQNGNITGITNGTATITATALDGSNTTGSFIVTILTGTAPVTGITLANSSTIIYIGTTFALPFTIVPVDAANKNVTWTSSADTVATVNANGLVTALNLGTTVITVTTQDGSFTATCLVNVMYDIVPISNIMFTPSNDSIVIGETITLNPYIIPANATDKTLTYSCNNASIAIVSANGVVTGISVGHAIITALANDGSGVASTFNITVTNGTTQNPTITISPTSTTFPVGLSMQMNAFTNPTSPVSWTSSDTSIATVTNGLVIGIMPGTVTITANISGTTISANSVITIVPTNEILPTSIIISQSNITVPFGQNLYQLSAFIIPNNSTNKSILWSTNNSAIVTVTQNGIFIPHNPGVATIIATTSNGIIATCEVTVTSLQVTYLYLPETISIQKNKSQQIYAQLYPASAVNYPVKWNTSNSSIASVDSSGNITAHSVGTAYIYAHSIQNPNANDTCIVTVVDESILVSQPIPNETIQLGTTTVQPYNFENIFSYTGASTIYYNAISSDASIAQAIVLGNKFAIVGYGPGTATITMYANTCSGLTIESSFDVTITAPAGTNVNCASLQVSESITNIECAGSYTGSAIITATGGTAPYSYKWSNYRSDNTITNMPAGTYSVIVTDANFCSINKTIEITETAPITITPTIVEPTCGNSDGSIDIAVTGGTAPYTYIWNNSATTSSISNLAAHLNTVTVTDGNGCSKTQTFEVNNANAPIVYINNITPSSCNPNNGTIDIGVTGGNGTYTYTWNDGNQNEDRTDLAAGNYSIVVKDDNNCMSILSVIVPTIEFSQPDISLVTVGSETGHNLIIWEKENTDAIEFYSIYRETAADGVFESVGTINYNDPSIFEDATADPQSQSYRYRISATGYCGNESPISAAKAEYKTINTFISQNTENVIIMWDAYEGINFYSYIIYKISGADTVEIGRVPTNINSFVYTTTSGSASGYFVGVELPKALDPYGLLKTESGPFILAMSNIAEAETLIQSIESSSIQIYPTEVTNNFTVDFGSAIENAKVEIFANNGMKAYDSGAITNSTIQIPTTLLAKGSYIVKAQNGNKTVTSTIIIK
jgi:uncharacterized protein YjdB